MTINANNYGQVWLVGAGPGDPELLTLKAMRVLHEADIVLYDSLISDDILAMLPKRCVRLHTGKRCGQHSMTQPDIHQALLAAARKYARVVRLKGGDPFMFGRGGEELEFLRKHRITTHVIPGITAAAGCAASAQIPLTHREFGNALIIHSGRSQFGEYEVSHNPTRVFYMGLRQAGQITGQLLMDGLAHDTPIALIINGTLANQVVHCSTLMELPQLASTCLNEQDGPGLIIVGEVTRFAQTTESSTARGSNSALDGPRQTQAVA